MSKIAPTRAVIAWTPNTHYVSGFRTKGKIEVRDRAPDHNEHWTDKYMCSGGAITRSNLAEAKRDPKGYVYRWFVWLTTQYDMDPKAVEAELKKIKGFEPWGDDDNWGEDDD